MKSLKLIIATIALSIFSLTANAQERPANKQIDKAIATLNDRLVAVDQALALTEDQKAAIYDIEKEKIAEIKKLREEGADEETIKAAGKAANKKRGAFLTKEQKAALKPAPAPAQ